MPRSSGNDHDPQDGSEPQQSAAVPSTTESPDLEQLDALLASAIEREEWSAVVLLAFQQASRHHSQQHFASSMHYCELAIEAWRVDDRPPHLPPSLQVDVLDLCALEHFYLAHYKRSAARLAQAQHLLLTLPAAPQRKADLAWTAALVERWRGNPLSALANATRALDVYAVHGSHIGIARLRIVLADITLDIAQPENARGALGSRDAFLGLAGRHVAEAIALSSAEHDPAGYCMAQLALIRFSRQIRQNIDRLAAIEAVGRIAQRLRDVPLLGQVHTALGDELASLGDVEVSHRFYHEALELLTKSNAPALGVWARRAILRAREMELDG